MYYVAVDVQTRCWNWLAAIDDGGYGVAWDGQRAVTVKAHRYSYEAFVGPISAGLELDHLCRNRGCVNPEHLEPVTPQVNNHRSNAPGAVARRRTHCPNGHNFAVHGVMRSGRRICRPCKLAYLREYAAQRRAARAAA